MTFEKLTKELNCKNYYVVEIVEDEDDENCPEYFISADDLDEDVLGYNVFDYDHISNAMAVVYLSVPKAKKELYDEAHEQLFENDVRIFLEAVRNLVSNFGKPSTIKIESDPKTETFTVEIDGIVKMPFAYEEV